MLESGIGDVIALLITAAVFVLHDAQFLLELLNGILCMALLLVFSLLLDLFNVRVCMLLEPIVIRVALLHQE